MIGAAEVPEKENCPPASGGALYCVTGTLFPAGNIQTADKIGTAWLEGMRSRGWVVTGLTSCCVCEGTGSF